MSDVECGRGHLYDNRIYATCPYCSNNHKAANSRGVAVDWDNRTMPIPGIANGLQNGMENNGAPLQNYSNATPVINDGKTLPPKNYNKAVRVDAENRTAGIMKEKYGIDPVVGWLVCIAGKEMGTDYKIKGQVNTIGRSKNMDICISKDNTISYDNHAKLSYSEKNNRFNLIPAENRNVIYLNDNEVLSPTMLNAYDVIDFGETKLMFIPFCGDKFDWKASKAGDTSNVSI